MEGTLGQARKDFDLKVDNQIELEKKTQIKIARTYHWIKAHSPVPFGKVDDIPAILGELSSEKSIHENHLNDDVDKIENFRRAIEIKVTIMLSVVHFQVSGNLINLLQFAVIENGSVEVLHKLLHTATFKGLPHVARHVEEKGLEEEDKTNPLVVGMVDTLLVGRRLVHSWVWHFFTDSLFPSIFNAKRRMDPAVGVCKRKEVGQLRPGTKRRKWGMTSRECIC